MRDTEAIRNLKSILRGTLRIITHDDRAFIGAFVGTDKSLNILLVNTEEFRIGGPPDERPSAGRYVGQVMIPWRLVRSVGLQVAGESTGNAGGYGAEQVRCVPLRS
jgi:small nuclear ribonucleoprotein (snRNP)-like protein